MNYSENKVKVNLGCGIHVIEGGGWVNCDNSILAKLRKSPLWFVAVWMIDRGILPEIYRNYPLVKIVDIRKKLPFNDNSVDYIYCSQVVEHLYLYDLGRFISECVRVLKPGGVMRILTPDLNKTINLYLKLENTTFEKNDFLKTRLMADHFNLVFYPRSWVLHEKRSMIVRIMDAVPEQHKYIFDFDSLYSVLKNSGFNKIAEVATQESSFPEVKIVDKFQDISLLVEAIK